MNRFAERLIIISFSSAHYSSQSDFDKLDWPVLIYPNTGCVCHQQCLTPAVSDTSCLTLAVSDLSWVWHQLCLTSAVSDTSCVWHQLCLTPAVSYTSCVWHQLCLTPGVSSWCSIHVYLISEVVLRLQHRVCFSTNNGVCNISLLSQVFYHPHISSSMITVLL